MSRKAVVQTVGTNQEDLENLVQQVPNNISYLASSSLLPKLSVEGSIPFARSNDFKYLYCHQVRNLRTKLKRFADGLQIPFLDGSPIWLLR